MCNREKTQICGNFWVTQHSFKMPVNAFFWDTIRNDRIRIRFSEIRLNDQLIFRDFQKLSFQFSFFSDIFQSSPVHSNYIGF